jgi:hypothetical protein
VRPYQLHTSRFAQAESGAADKIGRDFVNAEKSVEA